MRAYLASIIFYVVILSFFDVLFYNPLELILASLILPGLCLIFNWVLARLFKADATIESPLITGLILTLIVGPLPIAANLHIFILLAAAAMASKYLLTYRRKHIFNPAVVAVMASYIIFDQGASWWVSGAWILPVVLLGGLLIVKKIKRFGMIAAFLLTYFTLMFATNLIGGSDLASTYGLLERILLNSPIIFFAFVMLVEPQTSPTRKNQQIVFGIVTAILLVSIQNLLSVFYSLELSLLIANLLALLLGASRRFKLKLQSVVDEASDIKTLVFNRPDGLEFLAGQYLDWSLPHKKIDLRGSRRFFTIASSPSEKELRLTAKFPRESDKISSFKKALLELKPEDELSVTGPEGEFVLPKNEDKPLVWIAAGVGITPFKAMAQWLKDEDQTRDITLFYINRGEDSVIFKDYFDKNASSIGLKVVYLYRDKSHQLDIDLVKEYVDNYTDATYYLSGPPAMIKDVEVMLIEANIDKLQVKTDYFPGY